MHFDLNATPPTMEALAAARAALNESIPKLRLRTLPKRVAMIVAAVAITAMALRTGMAAMALGAVMYAVVMVVVTVLVITAVSRMVAAVINAPLLAATTALDKLAPITEEHCPETLAWCRDDQVLATYQSAVARQGRTLVEGEYSAMKTWAGTREARQAQADREAEQSAACVALRTPVTAAK